MTFAHDDDARPPIEDDYLRHASVLLDDGEVLVVPVEPPDLDGFLRDQAVRLRRAPRAKRWDR